MNPNTEVVEFLQRCQQVTCAAGEALEFSDQDAIDLALSDRRQQRAQLRSAFPAA